MGCKRAKRRDAAWNPPGKGGDGTALFAVLVAVPLLLPLAARLSSLLFALPLVLLTIATVRALAASRRRAPASAWILLGAGCAVAAVASVLGSAAAVEPALALPALYVGAGGSVLLLAMAVLLLRHSLATGTRTLLFDAVLIDGVMAALAIWFVIRPALADGEVVLTLVFAADVLALALAVAATVAAPPGLERRCGVGVILALIAASVGDGVVARGGSPAFTALMWALAGIGILWSAGDHHGDGQAGRRAESGLVVARMLLPFGAALAFPVAAAAVQAVEGLSRAGVVYFLSFFAATLALAFARQARLLLDNHRSAVRERGLHAEVVRRNRELEALTGLAATMAETLEEEPVIERGLSAIRAAARPTSMALHLCDGDALVLRATAGAWSTESTWATRDQRPGASEHAGRQIVKLPVAARASAIGLVTLVRPADDPLPAEQLELLALLADQVAIAVQNARDYRDRLEQAIRDPLTGVYNRRFFYEALGRELSRSDRANAPAALVLIDVDDFKRVNDTLGHIAGDHVLCEIARLAGELVRPADTFARVGGEEFALLLPDTGQLEGLLVAERLRRAVAGATILEDRCVCVSAGVAAFPDDAQTMEELEAKADAALYWAKRNGKNLSAVASEVVVGEERSSLDQMLEHLHALVSAIDAEHLKTRDHSENVAAYAAAIGGALGFPTERIVRLRRAALFHDIGKISVRAEILSKPTALTDEEYADVKGHSAVGASMLAHAGFPAEARWVRQHHERLDGRGYPDGLAGDAIELESRIILVADAFEAMTSDRPYSPGMAVPDALAELERCAGSQFDPRVVEALAGLLERDALPVLALRDA